MFKLVTTYKGAVCKPTFYTSKAKYEAGLSRTKLKYSKKPKLVNASGPGLPTISVWDGVVFNPGDIILTGYRKASIDEDLWDIVETWTNP